MKVIHSRHITTKFQIYKNGYFKTVWVIQPKGKAESLNLRHLNINSWTLGKNKSIIKFKT